MTSRTPWRSARTASPEGNLGGCGKARDLDSEQTSEAPDPTWSASSAPQGAGGAAGWDSPRRRRRPAGARVAHLARRTWQQCLHGRDSDRVGTDRAPLARGERAARSEPCGGHLRVVGCRCAPPSGLPGGDATRCRPDGRGIPLPLRWRAAHGRGIANSRPAGGGTESRRSRAPHGKGVLEGVDQRREHGAPAAGRDLEGEPSPGRIGPRHIRKGVPGSRTR